MTKSQKKKGLFIMKKSMIRIAAIALAVVMLSTCALTSIIAGYSVTDSATVIATVSGFGITVDVAEPNTANKILVPGGSGDLLVVTVDSDNGPSVAANLTLDATVAFSADIPVVITVNGTDVAKTSDNYADDVAAAIEAVTASYAANTAVDNVTVLTVGWKWTASADDNTVTDGATVTVTVAATIAQ